MEPHILIIDNALHRLLLRPPWHWRPHLRGARRTTVHLPTATRRPSLDGVTHLLLTGSEASILDPQPWYDLEVELIRGAVDRGVPILGSCFGHEMLVYALSGPAFLRRPPSPEIGWTSIEILATDRLFDDLPRRFRSFAFHFVEAHDLPAPWRVLGRSKACPTQLIRYGEKPIWGIQAHPEISATKARIFLAGILLLGLRPRREIARALIRRSPASNIASMIAYRFLSTGTQPCGAKPSSSG